METVPAPQSNNFLLNNLRVIAYIVGAFILFFFAIDLMISSLQHLGRDVAETILLATANPFNGLFIGLLITAMLQSSSTTTALVVALVASGSITLQSAIPIIMGANVGTTITSTMVSLGFINRRKEFRRAVAAGTYHDFFNLLTVIVLFPLEYYYGVLSSVSQRIAEYFFTPATQPVQNKITQFWSVFNPVIHFLLELIPSAFILTILAVVLLFSSILIFRRLISGLLKAKSPEAFSRFFFKSQFKSFLWGLLTTAAIRSSTITTSVVVPIVAKKIATLKQAAPFIMGANIGTTITAFIAATLNANTSSAVSIALVHFLFNLVGVMIFFPVPVLRKLPMELAEHLGKLTLKYRLAGLVYLLATFFFIPFSLIYFNQHSVQTLQLTYSRTDSLNNESFYRIRARMNTRTQYGEWKQYGGREPSTGEQPDLIYPVYVKNATLFIGNEMVLFNRPGFCWDGEQDNRKYTTCIEEVLSTFSVSDKLFDSVYVFKAVFHDQENTAFQRFYYSAPLKIMVQREVVRGDTVSEVEKLIGFEEN